jgi:hypothetical protein
MPRWAVGTIVVSPLATLLGQGNFAYAVELAREAFLGVVIIMSVWLVIGLARHRSST